MLFATHGCARCTSSRTTTVRMMGRMRVRREKASSAPLKVWNKRGHRRGRAHWRGPAASAGSRGGGGAAGAGAQGDAEGAKIFGGRRRNRHKRAIPARLERGVGGKRQLGEVELLVVEHALEALARAQN